MVLNDGFAIFEGEMKDLQNSKDPFLHEYLAASRLDRERHDQLIHAHEQERDHDREQGNNWNNQVRAKMGSTAKPKNPLKRMPLYERNIVFHHEA